MEFYGDRCPFLSGRDNEWYFSSAVSSNRDGGIFTETYHVPLNVFSHWYYEQRFNASIQKHVAKLFINNTLVAETVNNDARDFHKVKVYLSDPWHVPHHDYLIKDFEYGPL